MVTHPAIPGLRPRRPMAFGLALGLALVVPSACTMNLGPKPPAQAGIGFREARFAEISAMREYRQCRDEALILDQQARIAGSAARYLASARLLETCETQLGPEAANIAIEERMRAYGLSVQNTLKAGDVARAQAKLERFTTAFAGYDLYYPDGSSFVETLEILVGQRDAAELGRFSMLNVGDTLKSELRRARYWNQN